MKNLDTGKLSGPPMPHEEWKKNQDELERQERAKKYGDAPITGQDNDGVVLDSLTVAELKERAKDAGVEHYGQMNKAELIEVLGG